MDYLTTIISILSAAVSGGLVSKFLDYRARRADNEQTERKALLEAVYGLLDRTETALAAKSEDHAECLAQVQRLERDLLRRLTAQDKRLDTELKRISERPSKPPPEGLE